MKNAIVFDVNDIKKLVAEKCGVDESSVIKSQYSYIVVTEPNEGRKEDNESY